MTKPDRDWGVRAVFLPFERGGLSAWSIKKTFHTTVTVWIANLSDKRQRMLACELTGEEYSQPIDLFMFTKSNRRVPYRLDLLMEQVRLTVSSCAYSIDSFLYGSCCFGSFEGEEGRTVLYWDFEETLRWCHFISLPDSTRKGNSIGEERMRQDSTPLSIYLWRARDERAEKVLRIHPTRPFGWDPCCWHERDQGTDRPELDVPLSNPTERGIGPSLRIWNTNES